jgi:hypothetical protein
MADTIKARITFVVMIIIIQMIAGYGFGAGTFDFCG